MNKSLVFLLALLLLSGKLFANNNGHINGSVNNISNKAHSVNNKPVFASATSLGQMASSYDITPNLVSVWEFNETSGTTADDPVGGNDGTISGATVNQSGILGSCYSFDGSNDYVNLNNPTNLKLGASDYSWSFWLNPNSVSSDRAVICKIQNSSDKEYLITIKSGGVIRLDVEKNGNNDYVKTSTSPVVAGQWQHIVVSFESATRSVSIYYNGVSQPITGSIAALPDIFSNTLYIGGRVNYYNDQYFGGKLDQIAVWNSVLSEEEVLALYNGGNGLAYDQWDNVVLDLFAGSIAVSNNVVDYNQSPGEITGTLASGGDCGMSYTYEWEYTTDGATWFSTGTNGQNYTPPALTQRTRFRRKTICGQDSAYSTNTITIEVNLNGPGGADIVTGLMAHYSFEEANGTSCIDGAWNYDGIINGATINQEGMVGRCYDFDGVDDYISIPAFDRPSGAFTISAWINIVNKSTSSQIVCGDDMSDRSWQFKVTTDDDIIFVLFTGSGTDFNNSTTLLSDNTWYHVAVTYDGATNKVFINGTLEGSSTAVSGDISANTVSGINIGSTINLQEFLDGKIDEVRIYNRALTNSEVESLYNEVLLTGGTITSSDTSIVPNTSPGEIVCSPASGGNCEDNYSYLWEYTIDGTTWLSTGANGQNYTPPALTRKTSYRRKTICGGESVYSSNIYTATMDYNGSGEGDIVTGLLSHYKFEEVEGTTCYDETWNSDGTIYGATVNQNGKIGRCYRFDGTDDVIDLPAIALGGNTGSICGWFKNESTSGDRKIVGRYWQQHSMGIDGSGNYYLGNWNNEYVSSGVVADTSWHHMAMTYDGSLSGDNIKFYIDGILVGSKDETSNNSSPGEPWQIGSHGNYGHYWDGLIDEVRFYDRVLTLIDIQALYQEPVLDGGTLTASVGTVYYNESPGEITGTLASGGDCGMSYTYEWEYTTDGATWFSTGTNGQNYTPPALTQRTRFRRKTICGQDSAYSTNTITIEVNLNGPGGADIVTGLMAHYSFEEANGTSCIDGAWNYDGIINGATINQEGMVGRCYDFDGVDDYISIPAFDRPSGAFTISAWINIVNKSTSSQIVCGDDMSDRSWQFKVTTDDDIIFVLFTGSGTDFNNSTTLLSDNTWYHVAVTYDGATNKVFINGTLEGSSTAVSGDISANTVSGINIGSTINLQEFLDGKIDEVRIYNRALTNSEVESLYNEVLLTGGTITSSDTSIVPNTSPGEIVCSPASGGVNPLTYQWQDSTQSGVWTDIVGANNDVYTPPPLFESTWYRRKVTDNDNKVAYSNEVEITVKQVVSGLVSVWELDETSGSVAIDQINGFNGAITDATINQIGKIRKCYAFDGNSDYIRFSDNTTLSPTTSFTFCAWIKVTDLSSNGAIYCSGYGTDNFWELRVSSSSSGIEFREDNDSGNTKIAPSSINLNTWHYVTITKEGNTGTNLSMFVDGVLVQTGEIGTVNSSGDKCIGVRRDFIFNYDPFEGYIDQPAIWNRALSIDEIQFIYNSGNGLPYAQWDGSLPELLGGTLSETNDTVNYDEVPDPIIIEKPASGGTGVYVYKWQDSTSLEGWNEIIGEIDSILSPEALQMDTWFRRIVYDSNNDSAFSNAVTIKVNLYGGIISSEDIYVDYDSIPEMILNEGLALGGSGAYNYQWQDSVFSRGWTDIIDETDTIFLPENIRENIWFRRKVYDSDLDSTYSNVISIKLKLFGGIIACQDTLVGYDSIPAPITNVQSALSDEGSFNYQWQDSTAGTTWNDILDAVDSIYVPNALQESKWYRRKASIGDSLVAYSNTVSVKVKLYGGLISCLDTLVEYNSLPGIISNEHLAAGGFGVYAYQWQDSTTGSNWEDILGETDTITVPSELTVDRWFRRKVTDEKGQIAYSNLVNFNVVINAPEIESGLLAVWEFDENAGTNVTDDLGTYNGTNIGATINQEGKIGQSYSFDGTDDYVNLNSNLGLTGFPFSVSAWVKIPTSDGSFIISDQENTSTHYRAFSFSASYLGKIGVNYFDGNGSGPGDRRSFGSEEGLFSVNEWVHIVLVAENSVTTNPKVYVNGNPIQMTYSSGTASSISFSSAKLFLNVTSLYQDEPSVFRKSEVDQIACWEKSLTANEVLYLYNSGNGLPHAQWKSSLPELYGGTLSERNDTVNYDEVPDPIIIEEPASGGFGEYEYKWQDSTSLRGWNEISGEIDSIFSPSTLKLDTWFRRIVYDANNDSAYSNAIAIKVNLYGGIISTLDTLVDYDSIPGIISNEELAIGSSGIYDYQWQDSIAGGISWNDIEGAVDSVYTPTALHESKWFRRKVSAGDSSLMAYSNSVSVKVNLYGGLITCQDTFVEYDSIPEMILSEELATGGSGTYSYQWQDSVFSRGWADIQDKTDTILLPEKLRENTWFRRVVYDSDMDSAFSNVISIKLKLFGGIIACQDSLVDYDSIPAPITNVQSALSEEGLFVYQWQDSVAGGIWSDIEDATDSIYTPSALQVSNWFRRKVSTSDSSLVTYSNKVFVKVKLYGGLVSCLDTLVEFDSIPDLIINEKLSFGGDGIYSFQWQDSIVGRNWTDIMDETDTTLLTGKLQEDKWFRRLVYDSAMDSAYSNEIGIAVVPAPINLVSGLVSVWEFDETSGSVAIDQVGGNDGILGNGITLNQEGLINKSCLYDRSSSAQIEASSSLDFNDSDISISIWIKWDGSIQTGESDWMSLFLKGSVYNDCEYQVLIKRDVSSNQSIRAYVNGGTRISNTITLGTDWRHFVFTYDHSYVRLYIDGIEFGNSEYSAPVPESSYNFFTSGRDRYFFGGLIDQTSIWDRALTADEISVLYNSGDGLSYSQWNNNSVLVGGIIATDTTVVNSGDSIAINVTEPFTGGSDGYDYIYTWQDSVSDGNWQDIIGGTDSMLSISGLFEDTWYRLKVECNDDSVYSNTLLIRLAIDSTLIINTESLIGINGFKAEKYHIIAPNVDDTLSLGTIEIFSFDIQDTLAYVTLNLLDNDTSLGIGYSFTVTNQGIIDSIMLIKGMEGLELNSAYYRINGKELILLPVETEKKDWPNIALALQDGLYFTPDGDGSFDLLLITGIQNGNNFLLQIKDADGNVVYESNDYLVNWDGIDSSTNELVPMGIYIYTVIVDGNEIKGQMIVEY